MHRVIIIKLKIFILERGNSFSFQDIVFIINKILYLKNNEIYKIQYLLAKKRQKLIFKRKFINIDI